MVGLNTNNPIIINGRKITKVLSCKSTRGYVWGCGWTTTRHKTLHVFPALSTYVNKVWPEINVYFFYDPEDSWTRIDRRKTSYVWIILPRHHETYVPLNFLTDAKIFCNMTQNSKNIHLFLQHFSTMPLISSKSGAWQTVFDFVSLQCNVIVIEQYNLFMG